MSAAMVPLPIPTNLPKLHMYHSKKGFDHMIKAFELYNENNLQSPVGVTALTSLHTKSSYPVKLHNDMNRLSAHFTGRSSDLDIIIFPNLPRIIPVAARCAWKNSVITAAGLFRIYT